MAARRSPGRERAGLGSWKDRKERVAVVSAPRLCAGTEQPPPASSDSSAVADPLLKPERHTQVQLSDPNMAWPKPMPSWPSGGDGRTDMMARRPPQAAGVEHNKQPAGVAHNKQAAAVERRTPFVG